MCLCVCEKKIVFVLSINNLNGLIFIQIFSITKSRLSFCNKILFWKVFYYVF